MLSRQDIEKKIKEIGPENTLNLGEYIIELKKCLESPEDLTTNPNFLENFKTI